VIDTGNQKVVGGKGIEITSKDASGQPITTLSSSSGSGATITIPYSEADVTAAGGTENQIVIGSWSDEKQQWDPLPTTCDTTNNICTATTSHFSTFATIVATSGGAPSTPSGLSAAAVSSTSINLSWTQTSGATSYDIYRSTSSGGTFARIGTEPTVSSGSTTSFTETGLTASTTYYYKISALNASGESAASGEVSAATSAAYSGSRSGSIGGGSIAKAKTIVQQEKPITAMTTAEITAKIAQIQALMVSLQTQLAALTGQTSAEGIPSGFKFAAKLKLGMKSLDVRYLQSFLKAQGPDIYPEGLITGYYGAKTVAAVTRFQEKFASEILQPFGLANGTGILGEKTMQKINKLLGR
jgi:hypothetical protein